MKKLLLILLSSLTLLANNVMLYDFSGKVEVSDVINNKLNEYTYAAGQTFTLTNGLSIKTETNGIVSYVVPHRIAFTQTEGSSVYFNGDIIEYSNTFDLPNIVRIKDSSFNFSLMGQLYLISDFAKTSTIGTSMANISFEKAKLFVKAGEKYTQVYVVEGKVVVFDNKSKKKKELKENDYLVITPQVVLSAREAKVTSSGNSFSIKEIEEEEKQAHDKEMITLQSKLKDTIFVNYGSNIFGVKLGLP
jgi:hypothetical protein